MKQILSIISVLACVFCFVAVAVCQEQGENVTVCQLKSDPPTYNHKLVKVTGFVSHNFEDFTLFDPTCPSWPAVWLEYGGTSKSGTMYCCGVTADRQRPKELVVENIPIPLTNDEKFREFDRLIQPPFRSKRNGSIIHATLMGRFFSGKQIHYPNMTHWGGYGHMGCCSLLAIQQIESVSPKTGTTSTTGHHLTSRISTRKDADTVPSRLSNQPRFSLRPNNRQIWADVNGSSMTHYKLRSMPSPNLPMLRKGQS